MKMAMAVGVWTTAAALLAGGQQETAGDARQSVDRLMVGRFLSSGGTDLTSYRAVRHLEASTRGGRMRASLSALTWFDAASGFSYSMASQADVLMVGSSTFSMTYDYSSVNGLEVHASAPDAADGPVR